MPPPNITKKKPIAINPNLCIDSIKNSPNPIQITFLS